MIVFLEEDGEEWNISGKKENDEFDRSIKTYQANVFRGTHNATNGLNLLASFPLMIQVRFVGGLDAGDEQFPRKVSPTA